MDPILEDGGIVSGSSLRSLGHLKMGVSKNNGTPKSDSSILTGFSIINHPFWDTNIFGNTQIHMESLAGDG